MPGAPVGDSLETRGILGAQSLLQGAESLRRVQSPPERIGFLDGLGAAFRTGEAVALYDFARDLVSPVEDLPPDPDFQVPWDELRGRIPSRMAGRFSSVRNAFEYQHLLKKVEKELEDERILQAAPFSLASQFIEGILSPSTLIPLGVVAKGAKLGKGVLQSVRAGAAGGFVGAGVFNTLRLQTRETATPDEAVLGIALGTAVGATLGGGFGLLGGTRRTVAAKINRAADEMVHGIPDQKLLKAFDEVTAESLGAAGRPMSRSEFGKSLFDTLRAQEPELFKVHGGRVIRGLEKLTSPHWSIASPLSYLSLHRNPVVQAAAAHLFRTGLLRRLDVMGRSVVPVETLMVDLHRSFARAINDHSRTYRQYKRAGGTLDPKGFNAETGRALSRWLDDPENLDESLREILPEDIDRRFVRQAAEHYRPLQKEVFALGQDAGLYPRNPNLFGTAPSHYHRVWNHRKVELDDAGERKLEGIFEDHYRRIKVKNPKSRARYSIQAIVGNAHQSKGMQFLGGAAGSAHERTVLVPDQLVEDFLNRDPFEVFERLIDDLGARAHLVRAFAPNYDNFRRLYEQIDEATTKALDEGDPTELDVMRHRVRDLALYRILRTSDDPETLAKADNLLRDINSRDQGLRDVSRLRKDLDIEVESARSQLGPEIEEQRLRDSDYEKAVTDLSAARAELERRQFDFESRTRELESMQRRRQDVDDAILSEETLRQADLQPALDLLEEASEAARKASVRVKGARARLSEMVERQQKRHQRVARLETRSVELQQRLIKTGEDITDRLRMLRRQMGELKRAIARGQDSVTRRRAKLEEAAEAEARAVEELGSARNMVTEANERLRRERGLEPALQKARITRLKKARRDLDARVRGRASGIARLKDGNLRRSVEVAELQSRVSELEAKAVTAREAVEVGERTPRAEAIAAELAERHRQIATLETRIESVVDDAKELRDGKPAGRGGLREEGLPLGPKLDRRPALETTDQESMRLLADSLERDIESLRIADARDGETLNALYRRLKVELDAAEFKRVKAHLDLTRDRLLGRDGRADGNDAAIWRAARVLKNLAVATFAPTFLISSLPDVFNGALAHGWGPLGRATVAKIATIFRGASREPRFLRELAIMESMVKSRRSYSFFGLAENTHENALERGVRGLAQKAVRWSGFDWWNGYWTRISGMAAMDNVIRRSQKLAAGTATTRDRAYLGASKVSDELALRIDSLYRSHGGSGPGGFRYLDFETLAQTERHAEAAGLIASVIQADASRGLVQVLSGHLPRIFSSPFGKTALQFKSFMFAFHQENLVAAVQRAGLNPIASEYSAMGAMITMGSFVQIAKKWMEGDETFDEYLAKVDDNPLVLVRDAIDRSGVTSVMGEINNAFDRFRIGLWTAAGAGMSERVRARNIAGTLLGPVAGKIQDTADILGATRDWRITDSVVDRLYRNVPLNFWYLRRVAAEARDAAKPRIVNAR